jgi:hypothetical protein
MLAMPQSDDRRRQFGVGLVQVGRTLGGRVGEPDEPQPLLDQRGDCALREARLRQRLAQLPPKSLRRAFFALFLSGRPDNHRRAWSGSHQFEPDALASGSSSRCRWTTK